MSMLRNARGQQMFSYELLPLFGLKGSSPIPPDFQATKQIDGIWVHIVPRSLVGVGGTPKRRVMAECPKCDKLVCAGHLMQHMKIHREK